ncbi:hypothetical protein ACWCOW_36175, partial [Streptomyces sp. NPDC001939]
VTMFTDDTVELDGPVLPGPALHEWADLDGRAGTTLRDDHRSQVPAGLDHRSLCCPQLSHRTLQYILFTRHTDHRPRDHSRDE